MATLSSIITPTNITTASNTQTLTNKTLTSPTITGGALNGTLGATTPSTVAGTTGTFSGNVGLTNGKLTIASAGNVNGIELTGSSTNLTSISFVNSNASAIQWNWGVQGGTYATAGTMSLNLSGVGDAITVNGSTRSVSLPAGLNSTAIGASSASTGAFSTLSATGIINSSSFVRTAGAPAANYPSNAALGYVGGTTAALYSWGASAGVAGIFSVNILSSDASINTIPLTITSAGAAITGTLSSTGNASVSGTSAKEILIATTSNAYSFLKLNSWGLDRAYLRAEAVNPGAGSGAGSGQLVFQLANNPTMTTVGTWNNTGLAVTGDISSTARITTNDSAVRSGLTGGTMTAVNTNTAGSASPSLYIENNSDTGYGALQVYAKGSRSGTASAIVTKLDGTTTDYHIDFINDNGIVGTISTNASATAYNTSSDYRLKEITGPVVDSGTFIDALKPKAGTWKVDGSKFVGFLAHEFAEVSPLSVSGEKDAVDADGKPVYQSMQASSSEVIANLVAELQSLRKRLAALESK